MNLYTYEFKSSWKSLLIWVICIVGFLVFTMSMFPSFAQNSEATDAMLENFSPEMLKALGMDIIDFSKPMDYLAYMYQYLLVAVGAFAVLQGGAIISKEEADKTIEFLYAKPISRTYISLSKTLAALSKIFIMATSFYGSMLITIRIFSDNINYAAMFNMSLGLLLFMMIFMSVGLVLGHFITKTSKRLPIGLGILFLLYLTSIIVDINEKFEGFKFITPFKYFSGIDIVHNGFSANYVIISIGIILAGLISAQMLYKRKDLHI